jgi:hypothetical protein
MRQHRLLLGSLLATGGALVGLALTTTQCGPSVRGGNPPPPDSGSGVVDMAATSGSDMIAGLRLTLALRVIASPAWSSIR